MNSTIRFDPRIHGISQQVKSLADPQSVYYEKARDVRAEYIDGGLHLYRYEDILAINRHPEVMGNGGRGGSFGQDGRLIPLEVDGPDHKKWRRLLDPMFAPKAMARLEKQIRDLARSLISEVQGKGGGDLHSMLCAPLPSQTFLGLVGAPLEDLDFFVKFKEGVVHPQGDTTEQIEANMAVAGAELLQYFDGFLKIKRGQLGDCDDLIADLLRSEVDGEPISEADLLNILFLLMFAGLDTVTASLSCLIAWLGKNPVRRQQLCDDPSLMRKAIEELMRYESPVPSGMRFPATDVDLGGGLVVPAGEQVNAIWAAANVDPSYHLDPLRVDFDRDKSSHMTFASGAHRCLGSHLARLELRIVLEELVDLIPNFELDTDALVYDNVAVRSVSNILVSV